MPLVTSKNMLLDALNNHYAVGAFNAYNLEMAQAFVEAAEEERSPVIIQISRSAIEYAGLGAAAALVRSLAESASVPVVLHLDHGTDFELEACCLREGFTSVMYDGTEQLLKAYMRETGDENPSFETVLEKVQSKEAFDENVRVTKMVVRAAHAGGIPVEAELGKIPRICEFSSLVPAGFDYKRRLPEAVQEKVEKLFPSPSRALEFADATGCDSLAIACGSIHGMIADIQPLRIPLIQEISRSAGIPLVLHGSSGVVRTAQDALSKGLGLKSYEGGIREAIEHGVAKVNVSTELQAAFLKALRAFFNENPEQDDFRKAFSFAKARLKERVRAFIRLFGSSGRA